MAKYLFVYHAHGAKPPTDPAEQKNAMDAWGAWFGSMGAAVIDGGNPVGKSSTVKSDGSLAEGGGANPVAGYSLIEASSLEDAHKKAKGCPMLAHGGTIEIAQTLDM
ncbi:YciI family protein [Nitratireductor sp. GCM10026969]|uniref:YciI family protein n=2 Tax=Phyllobacteriaceae TaxID=69277 RepID=UPI00360F5F7C